MWGSLSSARCCDLAGVTGHSDPAPSGAKNQGCRAFSCWRLRNRGLQCHWLASGPRLSTGLGTWCSGPLSSPLKGTVLSSIGGHMAPSFLLGIQGPTASSVMGCTSGHKELGWRQLMFFSCWTPASGFLAVHDQSLAIL